MTAVASPPAFQSVPRNGWSNLNGDQVGMNQLTPDQVQRMFIPNKSIQRQNSGSSINSATSYNSAASTSSTQTNGVPNGDIYWNPRKKPARGLWPSSKAEPVSGLSTARPQSIAASSGPSATSAISALHAPSLLPSQHMVQSQSQQNVVQRAQGQVENPAILHLLPINGTFERKTITVPFSPDVLRIGRQTNQKTLPTPQNGFFDSKVLSRQHAEVWAEREGKVWIRDVKSSNGTFVNGQRLSQENRDSEPHLLREQDVLELGIDIVSEDQKTVVHHKVAARVEHAGIYGPPNPVMDLNFGDLDPSNGGSLISHPMSQNMRRSLSQASNGSSNRFGPPAAGGSNMNLAAYHAKWLQPVTMEQVVKRLGTELRSARTQHQDLHQTTEFFENVLTTKAVEGKPNEPQVSKASPPRPDFVKSRFSAEPPAPPPSQPLPEKPSGIDCMSQDLVAKPPILRRMETERPIGLEPSLPNGASPIKVEASHQISSLVDALTTAQQELNSQSERLKGLEYQLAQEREAREIAEARARGLAQNGTSHEISAIDSGITEITQDQQACGSYSSNTLLTDPNRLQQRLDLMLTEMEDLKVQMQRYKQRAEIAEETSANDRHTLAEMVEKIRKEEDDREDRRKKKREARKKKNPPRTLDGRPEGKPLEDDESDSDGIGDEIRSPLVREGLRIVQSQQEGTQLSPEQLRELRRVISTALNGQGLNTSTSQRSRRQEQLVQSAPYASIVGVVLIGWGLMAYLNGWQGPVER